MPIYEYRCERGHTFEVLQRMTDDPVSSCATCEAAVQRVLHPVAVHFKGSGFYTTDYGRKGRGSGSDSSDTSAASSDSGGSDGKTDKTSKGEKGGSKASGAKSSSSSS
jgi:putative FmdB family regulatory protein